jgi:hypothetical protein
VSHCVSPTLVDHVLASRPPLILGIQGTFGIHSKRIAHGLHFRHPHVRSSDHNLILMCTVFEVVDLDENRFLSRSQAP